MAPRDAPDGAALGPASTIPGLWKYPSHRAQQGPVTGTTYMASRRLDDGAEGLWRVHDKLYDVTDFIKRHPGGEHWLRITQGTDITEAFESHHLTERAPELLAKFYVRDATQPRNSPYTFRDDGFYRVLKRRAAAVLAATPESPFSRLFNDVLVASALLAVVAAARLQSYAVATVAAALISFSTVCAHNFTHMRNNWRMYYKSLGFMSLSEWRVSHILSHHLYPNTLLDIEISMHEPLLQFLPTERKSFIFRFASYAAFAFYASIALLLPLRHRLVRLQPEDLLPLLHLALMVFVGGASPASALAMWLYLWVVHSFVFHCIGLTAAHHHPDIFHDGDAPREDRDWGLGQLDAVRDRADHGGSPYLVLTQYGDHALHHLFPTVDHCRLPALYPALRETLAEFGVEYRFTTTWELFKGAFKQLARTTRNPRPPGKVIALGHHHRE